MEKRGLRTFFTVGHLVRSCLGITVSTSINTFCCQEMCFPLLWPEQCNWWIGHPRTALWIAGQMRECTNMWVSKPAITQGSQWEGKRALFALENCWNGFAPQCYIMFYGLHLKSCTLPCWSHLVQCALAILCFNTVFEFEWWGEGWWGAIRIRLNKKKEGKSDSAELMVHIISLGCATWEWGSVVILIEMKLIRQQISQAHNTNVLHAATNNNSALQKWNNRETISASRICIHREE